MHNKKTKQKKNLINKELNNLKTVICFIDKGRARK